MYDFRFADNVSAMITLLTKGHDLGLADPNYGIGETKRNHKSRNTPIRQRSGNIIRPKVKHLAKKDWDDQPPDFHYFRELFRTTKNQIIFGANYFSEIVGTPFKTPRRPDWEQFLIDHPRGWILWDKVNSKNDFNDCELIWTSFDFPSRIYSYMWNGMMQGKGMYSGTVQQGNKRLNEKRIHFTQKPVILYQYLMNCFCNESTTILDPNLGSRSSAIAHYKLKITGNFTGIENDPDHWKDGERRFNNFISQTTLL